jgi:hypothetical protein
MVREDAPHLLGGWSTDSSGSHAQRDGAESGSVNDPPTSVPGPCNPNAHEGGEDGNRQTEAGSTPDAPDRSRSPPACRFLGRHEHHAAAAAVPDTGGIALEDRQIRGSDDDRRVGWSLNGDRREVVVEAVAGPTIAHTAVRLCVALLNRKAQSQLLTAEKLNGGPAKHSLEGLVVSHPYLLRTGRTLGWLRNVDAEGNRFLDRLRRARNDLLEDLEDLAAEAEDG